MAGLPKKYARMGFKKGWKAFRKAHNKTKKVKTTMPRKRRRRSSRRSYKKSAKSSLSSIFTGKTGRLVGAGIYGMVRKPVSDALAKYTSQLPAGELSDEAGMLLVGWLADSYGKGAVKKVGQAGMMLESARIGEYLFQNKVKGMLPNGAPANNQTSGMLVIG